MGYETRYDLSRTNNSPSTSEIAKLICEIGGYPSEHNFMTSALEYGWGIKWYDHEKDMIKVSEHWPDVEFVLNGVGDDFPDIWRKTFKNGQISRFRAVIRYEPYPLSVPPRDVKAIVH